MIFLSCLAEFVVICLYCFGEVFVLICLMVIC